MALADEPFFEAEEIVSTLSDITQPTAINEWQRYYIRFYDAVPAGFGKNVFCREELHSNIFEVNFANFVGLAKIGDLKLQIHNKKISNQLYEQMLNDLARHYASLVFAYATPVGQHYSKSVRGEDSAFVEYLFLKKYLLNQELGLDAIAAFFVYNPHRIFCTDRPRCAIQDCHSVDPSVIHSIIHSPMVALPQRHPLSRTTLGKLFVNKNGMSQFPTEAINIVKHETVDTNENRFIKHFMQELLRKIERLQRELVHQRCSFLNPEVKEDLDKLRQKLFHFLSLGMWQEVGSLRLIPANSQVLLKRDGYRQLFSLYSLLQLATRCDFLQSDFKHLAETKDVPTLYEYWCFFEIKAVLETLSVVINVDRLVNKGASNHTLIDSLCIEYKNGVKLFFNKTYSGSSEITTQNEYNADIAINESYSHNLRPDIILELNGQRLIFDAKYKGKKGGFYCSEDDGTVGKWKEEDIDKMHTYREAIRNVAGSYILFPGRKSAIYPAHNSLHWFEGVGAFALRPGDEKSRELSRICLLIADFIECVRATD